MAGLAIRTRHICSGCHQRPTTFSVFRSGKRHYKASADHDLCQECWRSERDSLRAARLKESDLSQARRSARRGPTVLGIHPRRKRQTDLLLHSLHQALFSVPGAPNPTMDD
jgi:hypothetical protein